LILLRSFFSHSHLNTYTHSHIYTSMPISKSYQDIYSVVSLIPKGRVTTYGQIARLVRKPGQARLVGYALNALHGRSSLPWHRVVNAKGKISLRSGAGSPDIAQRLRLEKEGVRFNENGTISLTRFQWIPGAVRDKS
jgi:methylated-DNA-protein-cysteine methyltransferase related protein